MTSTLLLHIETSSPVCSVALSRSGTLIALKELAGNANHAAMLTMIIDQLMNESKIEMKALDGIALSAGPGSYTGLRIGAATAKGLCFALDKPLISVDSLQSLAVGMSSIQKNSTLVFCPTIDARRDEIYYGLYLQDGTVMQSSTNIILTADFMKRQLVDKTIVIGGSGAIKCKKIATDRLFQIDLSTTPSATWMIRLAEKQFVMGNFSDPVYFEPNYIKPAFISSSRVIL